MMQKIKYLITHPLHFLVLLLTKPIPYFDFLYKTADYQGKINFGFWFRQKVLNLGGNRKAYWPVHWTSDVSGVERTLVGVDAYPGIMGGCYINGRGGLTIGDYTQIAPNVIIVTANHNVYDTRKHIEEPVYIGKYCWLGGGCKIMPGVVLGDWTVVAAGTVVTKSFPEGYCVLGGVPARKIRDLDKSRCIPFENKHRFIGYLRESEFGRYRERKLKI